MKTTSIIAALRATSKLTEKRAILRANADNQVLQGVFFGAYASQNYFLRLEKTPRSTGAGEITVELLTIIKKMLVERAVTGNAARDWIESVLEALTAEDQELLVNMINHDLDCGTGRELANELWTGLIPEFQVMLADKVTEKTIKPFLAANEIIVQTKEDGGRVQIIGGAVYSRNGNRLELAGAFERELLKLAHSGYVLDGELVVMTSAGVADRKTGNGIFNKAVRKTIKRAEAETFCFVLWDAIDQSDWVVGYSPITYRNRFAKLEQILSELSSPNFKLIYSATVASVDAARTIYRNNVDQGLEGVIIKLPDAPWEAKRSRNQLKLKEELDATLICISVEPHIKDPNLIGSLICQTSCGMLTTSVGSGLKDEDRVRKDFVGKLIDVKYNALIKQKTAGSDWNMFLPIYKGLRLDQNTADTLDKLKD